MKSLVAPSLAQSLAALSHFPGYLRFARSLYNIEAVQRKKLRTYLTRSTMTSFGQHLGFHPDWSYEEFAHAVPVHEYSDLEPWIQAQRQDPTSKPLAAETCLRFEPTSGSMSKRKWIPYTPTLLSEFDAAASAWLADLSLRYPGILAGRHYWSLSWLPTELRADTRTVDDLEVFPLWKKALMRRIMAVSTDISLLPSSESALKATLLSLVSARDLVLVSVWSPTFALQLLNALSKHREEVAGELGVWHPNARSLKEWDGSLDPDFFAEIWPRLRLISAWDSSTSAVWADELRKCFPPSVAFQGKGLWATEGVVTIPFRGRYPLMATAHFYEFRDLESGRIFPSWRLTEGQRVQPILSTGSGFFRYAMHDQLRVTGFFGGCPCFRFEGRLVGTDLVGEKIDPVLASEILGELNRLELGLCVSLLAKLPKNRGIDRPSYIVLAQSGMRSEIAKKAEELLLRYHHYHLARELGQLESADALVVDNAVQYFEEVIRPSARIEGSTKIESLALWDETR